MDNQEMYNSILSLKNDKEKKKIIKITLLGIISFIVLIILISTTDFDYTEVYVSYVAFDKKGNLLGTGNSILLNTVLKNSSTGFKIQPIFSCPFNIDEIDQYYVYAYDWNV